MNKLYEALLSEILPESLKADKQFVAMARALDEPLQTMIAESPKAMHLPRLDELAGKILDILAEQFHVDFYDAINLTDLQKRNLIRQSIAQHRTKGTVGAVEFVVNEFFTDAEIEELGGYLFKINAGEYNSTPEAFSTFVSMLMDAKNERSWLVGIDLDASPPESKVYVGNVLAENGEVTINPRQVKGSKVRLSVGNPLLITGEITIGVSNPTPKGGGL